MKPQMALATMEAVPALAPIRAAPVCVRDAAFRPARRRRGTADGLEDGSMRRILTGVVALQLVAASLLALAPAVSAGGSAFAGTWMSIDTDGSTQMLAIGQGSTPAVTFQDFYASSCDGAGAQSTHFVANGSGSVEGDSLRVEFRNGGCGSRKIGSFGLTYSRDDNGTLTDDFGVTWHRYP
jgi:hypothetical protein